MKYWGKTLIEAERRRGLNRLAKIYRFGRFKRGQTNNSWEVLLAEESEALIKSLEIPYDLEKAKPQAD